ncbi:hypothetical protein M501DRAFT_915202, partial [Patellaria atrata CBS 101060]
MNYINRREAGNDTNEKPLNTRQAGSTMIRYSRVWRTKRRPTYRLTGKQQECLSGIIDIVREDKDEEDGEGREDEEEYNVEDLLGEEEEAQLESNTLAFLLSLLDHQLKDSEYQSALISATAAFGVDADQGWKGVLAYTPTLSAIITVARMLVLYQARQTRIRSIEEMIGRDGIDGEKAQDLAPSHFELVK